MQGIRTERQRMNLPFGMSELDLIAYNPTLYDLYRNEGNGWDNDAFRYDPVVSTGMLASDYAYAQGMAWVNYQTPESQMAINPGDDLIVPVQTYDNYENLPPWEKRLTHEVSFKGKNNESSYSADLLNIQASNVGMKNNFVGDFSYYFDNESRILGSQLASTGPVANPVSIPISVGPQIIGSSAVAVPTTPTPVFGTGTAVSPKPIVSSPLAPRTTGPVIIAPEPYGGQAQVALYRCINVAPWCVLDRFNATVASCSDCPQGSIPTMTDTGGGMIADTGPAPTDINAGGFGGGGGVGGGGGGGAEAPADQPTEDAAKPAETPAPVDCTIDYKPIIIGVVAGLVIGYLIAKSKHKDLKQFSAVGAIIGGILGYVYAKHQCTPISILTSIGVPSKSESGYYGGR